MTDDDLLRYSRHLLLDDIGIDGQRRLLAAHVLVVGVGGLGSPAALYLAASGIGRLTLIDADAVSLTNLQRQIAHRHGSIGQAKTDSAAQALRALNPAVEVATLTQRADAKSLARWLPRADLLLDCSDNFATRQLCNAACWEHGKPLVSGAAIRFDAQITVFDPRDARSPCYACLYPPGTPVEEAQCATMGIFAPLVGIIGAMQAAEALKLVVGIGRSLVGRLQMLDARTMQWTELQIARRLGCPVCGAR